MNPLEGVAVAAVVCLHGTDQTWGPVAWTLLRACPYYEQLRTATSKSIHELSCALKTAAVWSKDGVLRSCVRMLCTLLPYKEHFVSSFGSVHLCVSGVKALKQKWQTGPIRGSQFKWSVGLVSRKSSDAHLQERRTSGRWNQTIRR